MLGVDSQGGTVIKAPGYHGNMKVRVSTYIWQTSHMNCGILGTWSESIAKCFCSMTSMYLC